MSNFYNDNNDIRFHMTHLDLSRVIDLKECDFTDRATIDWAPDDREDALDNYHRVLEIVGEIAGDFIAPRAALVDEKGATFQDGYVAYAPETVAALDHLKKAGLMGFTLPRRYGGINIPKTVYSAAIEIISRADASLMNLFGLQEIADTICKFGSKEQKQRFLPRFTSGEVMGAMALTEPDAGSDLQNVALKATQDADGGWRLNGVKRFITNGCAEVSLVMARSEEGLAGGRGISLFIYEKDPGVTIRRIEHKLGIHGSPTCELQFNDAPAELLGKRKYGLVKYTMSLMNGARLGVAAQALGIAEAAFREADTYAAARVQFDKPIRTFAAVHEMLADMRVEIAAGRSLLYETARAVDIKEGLEELVQEQPDRRDSLRDDLKRYTRLAALLTPLVKRYTSEMANRVCDRALQIHGGVGYTCEFSIERLYRDARITNIYEGTSQLQVLAAIGGITGNGLGEWLDIFSKETDCTADAALFASTASLCKLLEEAVDHVKNAGDPDVQEFHAGRLVDMATDVIMAHLLYRDALCAKHKQAVAKLFATGAACRARAARDFILSCGADAIALQREVV